MKKNYFLFLFFLLTTALFHAQQVNNADTYLDSLYTSSSSHHKNYKYKEAIESALLLIEESGKAKNDYYRYQGHKILGGSYNDLNDTLRAKRNYEDALASAQRTEIDTLILGAYNNLGNIYSEDTNTTQIGIDYYNLVINLATRLGKTENIFTPVVNIAWTYLDNRQYKKAWPYLERAWELFGDRNDNLSRSQLATLTGRYYVGINEPAKAKPYFEEAIQLVEEDSLILQASVVYDEYSKLLYSEGNFEEAFLALEKFQDYNSQIFEQERIRQIEATNIKFDVSEYQKNLEIARNEQLFKDEVIEKSREKMLIMVISSIVLFIILLALVRIMISRRKLIKELSNKNEQLIQAKEEAERLSLLKTKFFSTISHELRTPLYGVIGLTSILLEDKSLKNHETDLKSLKFSADYLLALINDVLQMNKMESNLVKLENLPLNLKELLKSIVKSFEFTRLQNKNNIHLNIDPAIPFNLIGDPVRLSQVLMNLVGNAMKFTERGNIWINAEMRNADKEYASILFKIKDDGLGIPQNKQQIIFEEFSQLKSANYNYQGTGLGLPIVKKLLLLFGSEIQLESEEGVGSEFSFEIEFKKDLNVQEELVQDIMNIETSFTIAEGLEKNILIVDDNRINQVVTKRILEQKGFKCDICDNGTIAIEKVKSIPFDLVLMDVNMPGISGLEATRLIREFNSSIPIVALTAVEIEEIRDEIIQAGMNDIIVKPYDTSVFYQVIYRNIPADLVST
ncbi:response regulator [Antarcticibacterium arcticum]|uniref:histidine kinase n=1 Tax=Antarcticibacterium arcticum TaxID=2585771 RepID=A0A5B8YN06_9FLAO|nr:response regulator [Antarcticibacterium arcticum]QED37636.1 response regulator [Antarcticibacterium arcticum]